MHFFAEIGQFASLSRSQAPDNEYDSAGTKLFGLTDSAAAFGRSCMGNAAGVDDNQVRLCRQGVNLAQAEPFQQLANLLAFVLIYLAAESIYGKSSHDMI